MTSSHLYIGLMSGTSLDGVDAALIDFSNPAPKLIAKHFQAYPDTLLASVKNLCRNNSVQFNDIGLADAQLGIFYAEVIDTLLSTANISAHQVRAIGSHGQTVQHDPSSSIPYTIQLGDPTRIVEKTNITVVADFRRRDIAAGGQGAPLVPAFHQSVFHNDYENRAILNIGGISNITFLSSDKSDAVIGFDCGPGNTLLDQWCQSHFNQAYDNKGELCKSGTVSSALLHNLLSDRYFQKAYPKSTGPEYFNLDWLARHAETNSCSKLDTLTTLCELSAITIADSLNELPQIARVLVCGGGTHNEFLIQRIKALITVPLETTTNYGIHPDWVEATAFAWLAKQTIEGKPSNLPSVTGANKAVILGAIYPA